LIEIRSLEGVSFESLALAFNDAFSDYAVPANYPVDFLTRLLIRRGYRSELAAGAFDGDRLVGFVFNALHENVAYNSGTGVVISHRRRGIARQLMQHSIDTLPATRYFLEVIETNERAAALYRSLGFEETRRLQCWSYASSSQSTTRDSPRPTLETIRSWCDAAPSWQNETHSVLRAAEPYEIHGDEDCGAIFFPSNGDVAQLAVRPAARRQSRGRALLRQLGARMPLRIMNVDDRDAGIASFLERCNARRTVRQIEMVRDLREHGSQEGESNARKKSRS